MVKVFKPIRNKVGKLIRGFRILRFRKRGPTELTPDEKNDADWIYYPKDTSVLQNFIDANR
ncbi:unnamed protein product [marine sediment metagenome]|uniref:Uncharacterized protein n=1 Tax=marine sediment metagenome TaxID=412755 RepID=X1BU74_9ZZZZ